MSPLSIVVAVIMGLGSGAVVTAQTDRTRQEAYDRCVGKTRSDPEAAYDVCKEYLKNYPRDDDERLQLVRGWVAAYGRILAYAKAIRSFQSSSSHREWFIYEPDLNVDLSEVSEKEGKYKVEIVRSVANAFEADMLRKAEAVYGNQDEFIRRMMNDPVTSSKELPAKAAPLWGSQGNDNVEVTEVITTSAVRYYYDLSLAMRENRKFRTVYPMISTSLTYVASIKHYDDYEHGQSKFHDVYVADLNLEWSSICGGLCGIGFTRNKVVVFNNGGDMVALFLDAPANRSFWVS